MNKISRSDELLQNLVNYYGDITKSMHSSNSHDEVYDAVYYVLSLKGKKIRPLLLLHANQLFNGIEKEALPAALAVELFHNFSLVHDDIMDKAPIRRGKPTVHMKYGLGTAINTGDLLMILAYKYLTQINIGYLREALLLYNETCTKIMEGQSLDLKFETLDAVSVEDYLKMIELKTSVLIGFCMNLGALLAGATQEEQGLMYDLGNNIGLCFQLKDDWLDVYGDHKTGKQLGGDIIQSKKTFLYIKAWQLANNEQRKQLIRLGEINNDQDKIRDTIQIYNTLQIGKHTEELINEKYMMAMDCLDNLNINEEQKRPFFELIQRIYLREF